VNQSIHYLIKKKERKEWKWTCRK